MGRGFKTAFIPMAAGVRAFSPETGASPPPAGGGPGSGPGVGGGIGSGAGVGGVIPIVGALVGLMLALAPILGDNSRSRQQTVAPAQTTGASRSVDFSYSGPAVLD